MQRIFYRSLSTAALLAVLFGWVVCEISPVLAANGDAFSGHRLFQTYCLVCHGLGGKGDGIAADVLQTKPRDLTDDAFMARRTDQQLFEAIEQRVSPHGTLAMPAWQGTLTAPQIWDLVAYVRTLHRNPPLQGLPAQGAKLFTLYCWTCHGPTGKGDGVFTALFTSRPQDLTDHPIMSSRSDAELYTIISQGGAAVGRATAMPAWGHVLTPQEIWDLVAYIRHLSK